MSMIDTLPFELLEDSATQKLELGVLYRNYDGRVFRYSKLDSLSAASSDGKVFTQTPTKGVITDKAASGTSTGLFAGVGIGTIAVGQYGLVQVGGEHASIDANGDDDIADGDMLIVDKTASGVCDSIALGSSMTDQPFGRALVDDVNGTNKVKGELYCLFD